ncbi:MAG: non-canonical purine NTP pyrophosphatase [Planctomycetota bacterium]
MTLSELQGTPRPPRLDRLVIATKNPGKITELRELLAGLRVEVLGLADVGVDTVEPEETGATFLENATIKALDYARQTGLPCLADDSGLIVDALDGRPGVISSHYAWDGETTGEPATLTRAQRDERNTQRLLQELTGTPDDQRTARFTCTMVLAGARILLTSSGTFEGRIARAPHGNGGFGYDPVFLAAPDFSVTAAELAPDDKNAHSHRGHAVRAMIVQIETLASPAADASDEASPPPPPVPPIE